MRHTTVRARILVDERGVSLMELVVALTLNAVLLLGVMSLWQNAQKAYFEGAEAADVQQGIRVAMDRMVRTIQAAGLNPKNKLFAGATADDGAFTAFRQAGTRCLRIYGDLDGDGLVTGTDENLKFNWGGTAGNPLTQESGGGLDVGLGTPPFVSASGGDQELAESIVANPGGTALFQYYTGPNDASPNTVLTPTGAGCGTGDLSDANRSRIGRVVITLTGRGTVGSQTFTKTMVSEVRPRNVP